MEFIKYCKIDQNVACGTLARCVVKVNRSSAGDLAISFEVDLNELVVTEVLVSGNRFVDVIVVCIYIFPTAAFHFLLSNSIINILMLR